MAGGGGNKQKRVKEGRVVGREAESGKRGGAGWGGDHDNAEGGVCQRGRASGKKGEKVSWRPAPLEREPGTPISCNSAGLCWKIRQVKDAWVDRPGGLGCNSSRRGKGIC